jgi:U4/U6.U5 tri-snRNP component SNU23
MVRQTGMSMKIERSTLEQVKARIEWNKQKLEEKKRDYDIQERMKELKDEEERMKEYRREQRKEKKRQRHEPSTDTNQAEDEMAKMMGFATFGTSKK